MITPDIYNDEYPEDYIEYSSEYDEPGSDNQYESEYSSEYNEPGSEDESGPTEYEIESSLTDYDNVCFNEDDEEDEFADLFESLQLSTYHRKFLEERKNALAMANYHLSLIDKTVTDKISVSHRFTAECALRNIDERFLSEFKAILFNNARDCLRVSSNTTKHVEMDNDLCRMFYECICGNVVCSESNVWYFDNGRWKSSRKDYYIWNVLSNNFVKFLQEEDELFGAYVYINTKAARDRVVTDVKKRLFYSNFESEMDASPDIIGVRNGVLTIETGEVREGTISDLVSKNTNVDYIPYSMESREINYLFKILRKVFPVEDLLKFFIRSCSTFLEGRNSKKVFYVWWGSGNNCKTGMATLVQSALGEYCATVPVSLITSKRTSSSEATPELCHIEGKLAVFLQEPNPKEKIKTGRIKELTGNDKIFVRNLYQTGREIDVKCKIIHVCNFPTASPDTDVAFKRRMKVIKFPSTFLDPAEYEHQKQKGILDQYTYRTQDNIEDRLRALGSAFLGILVHEYKSFKEYGLETPPIIEQYTEDFLVHGNYVLKFIRKCLKHEKNGGVYTIDALYELFKNWIRTFYPSSITPNSETFIKELRDEGFDDKEGDGNIRNVVIMDKFIEVSI
jgi:phage/plasmid-associated DNA primase